MRTAIRSIFFGAFLLISGFSLNAQEPHWIKWEEGEKLEWKDFKARAKANSSFKALTASGFLYEMEQTSRTEVKVRIYSYFDGKQSWVDRSELNGKLLAHEQLHFDITEVYTRKFRQAVQEKNYNTVDQLVETLSKLFKEMNDQVNKQHDFYDKETGHSINEAEQEKWESKVAKELKVHEHYSKEDFEIILK
ncbi:MAG: hypothetical protein HKN39_02790 [Flavobacteriales bacterium]|nr:hypothetical protein [Flavobacteriales bacterium]